MRRILYLILGVVMLLGIALPIATPVLGAAIVGSVTRVPTADADVSGTWDTAPRWDDVDETTPNDSDFMTGTTDAGGYCLFTFTPFAVPADAAIDNLTVYIRLRDTEAFATTNTYERIKVNNTYYNGSTGHNAVSNQWNTYIFTWTTNPNTGAAWTVADINGTGSHPLQQIGVYSTDLDPDQMVSMVYAEVNYTIQTCKTRVPTADGDVSGTWNTAPRWDEVDETTPNDSDFMTGITNGGGYCLFTFTPFDVPAGAAIDSLTVYIRLQDTASGTTNTYERIKVNNNYYNGSTGHNASSGNFNTYSYSWTTNPNTGAAWTVADINGTGSHPLQQIGVYSTDLDPDQMVSMVYAEVCYKAANPSLAECCGMDVVLVLDSSDSIGDLNTIRNPAYAFVNALLPGTQSLIGVVEFDSQIVSPTLDLTNNVTNINNRILGISQTVAPVDELTNWQAALTEARMMLENAGSYSNDRDDSQHPDLIILISDGQPTTYGYPTGLGSYGGTEPDEEDIAGAICAANMAKTSTGPIRILYVDTDNDFTHAVMITGSNTAPPNSIDISVHV